MLSKLCTIYALRLARARLLPRRPMTMVCRRIGKRRSAGPENDEPRAVRPMRLIANYRRRMETKLAAEYHEKSGVPQIACVYAVT